MKVNLKVNKALLPGKVAFVAMMSAGLWTYPYIILFFKSLGLTTTECSIIYGSLPIVNGFFKLFIGAVADKMQKHKEMMLVFALISAFLMSCLLFVPPVEYVYPTQPEWNGTLHYKCDSTEYVGLPQLDCVVNNASILHPYIAKSDIEKSEWLKTKIMELESTADCVHYLKPTYQIIEGCLDDNSSILDNTENMEVLPAYVCQLDCSKYPIEYLEPAEPTRKMFSKTFWMIFCIYFLAFNIMASIWALLYGMNYAVLGDKRHNFGKQRLWGTIGALVTSIMTAVALNKYGSSKAEINFTPCFIGFGIWTVLSGISGMFFKLPHIERNPAMAKDMILLLKQPQIFLLFVVLFIMGFLWGAAETFLFVFLRSLNASSYVLGACLFARYLCEIPSLYYCGRIIKKIGHVKCLYIVLIAYCIRYLGTSLIPNPWWEIPFSCLKSVVFSIGFTAVSVFTSSITPRSMHATLQAMVQTVHFGIGRGIGILAFGPTMDVLGARWSFRIGSGIALVTFLFYIIAQQFVPPVKLMTKTDEEKDPEIKEPLKEENKNTDKGDESEDEITDEKEGNEKQEIGSSGTNKVGLDP